MGSFKDYYFILGISKNATQEEIEMAYRYSRDAIGMGNFGSFAANSNYQVSMLRDIDEAYECIGNSARRREYDLKLGSGVAPRPYLEENNPAVRNTNAKETLEMCFAAMKKKKSRSLPSLGRFVSAMVFMASVGCSAILGLNYFNTGEFSFSRDKSPVARTAQDGGKPRPRGDVPAPPVAPPIAQPGRKQGYVKAYDIPYGGVVSAARGECRKDPSPNSPVLARMSRNSTVFVTKESKGEDGETWYYVDCNAGKGWVRGEELKVYK
jgi:curved DNA-binding protein CbpA